ncbi:hypothetical protein [Symmachiella dynata]|uniref:hypothetical protein n=1 Tax=Symmachiella dynata TaxID=2527995 RepID=UPI0030EBE344
MSATIVFLGLSHEDVLFELRQIKVIAAVLIRKYRGAEYRRNIDNTHERRSHSNRQPTTMSLQDNAESTAKTRSCEVRTALGGAVDLELLSLVQRWQQLPRRVTTDIGEMVGAMSGSLQQRTEI